MGRGCGECVLVRAHALKLFAMGATGGARRCLLWVTWHHACLSEIRQALLLLVLNWSYLAR
jgi:hypothetical protein